MGATYRFVCLILSLLVIFVSDIQAQHSLQEINQQLDQAISGKDYGKAAFYAYEAGKMHLAQGNLKEAEDFLEKSIDYGKKGNDDVLTYLATERLGYVETIGKNYSKALDNYQRSLKIAQALNRAEFVKEALINTATAYALLNKHKRSIKPLEDALSLAIQDNDILLQQHCYDLLAEYYSVMGNKSKSKEYHTLHDNLVRTQETAASSQKKEQEIKELEKRMERTGKEKLSARNRLSEQSVQLRLTEDSLLATRYSLKEKEDSLKEAEQARRRQELEIELLSKDKELADLKIKEQETLLKNEILVRNGIIIGTLLVIALVSVVIVDYRRKINANRRIDQQNKSIQSSINYAKRIQEAMLSKDHLRERVLPESFILFKPRDTVSGDFYWFGEIKSWYNPDVIMAAVDCTGHGIPGAFMSMIGINSLNGIIAEGIAESDHILNALDKEIRSSLQQETSGNNDGMDIALCIYRREKNILEFSGAKNPLIYIQEGKLHRVKGDSHAIGGSGRKENPSFTKHLIAIEKPTMIYLFSDGYRDQFGGKDNTKFMSKRFNELLLKIHTLPVSKQQEILDSTILSWMKGHHQTDDILVMGIRLEPGSIE